MNIYLYGNCQTSALRRMILELYPDWIVDATDLSHLTDFSDVTGWHHLGRARVADIVIAQPVGQYRGQAMLSTDALRAALPATTPLLTFPSLFFDGLQGCYNYLREHIAGYRSDYHNAHTLDMFFAGYRWEDIASVQVSPEFYTRAFVHEGIDAALAELRQREAEHATTATVSGFLDSRCRSEVMMNTINHPKRVVLVHILRQLLTTLGLPGDVPERGTDYLGQPFFPPLPTVLFHLGIADASPQLAFGDGQVTRTDHVIGSLHAYARYPRAYLRQAFVQSRSGEFVEAFRKGPLPNEELALADTPLIVSAPATALIQSAFASLLRREPSAEEMSLHLHLLRGQSLPDWLRTMAGSDDVLALASPAPPVPDATADDGPGLADHLMADAANSDAPAMPDDEDDPLVGAEEVEPAMRAIA